jgi:hypothetical protein
MPEIGTFGLMSGDGKRGVAEWPKLPRPSSTLPTRKHGPPASGAAYRGEPDVQTTVSVGPFLPSRPGEFHPEPLTDPDLNLSIHPARVTARRLPPSIELQVPPDAGCPTAVDPIQWR